MIVALIIFAVTLTLVIVQPRGLKIGYSAITGALVALLVGVIHLTDIPIVWGIIWNATLTFIALIIISLILNAAGFFRFCALHVGAWGNGNGRKLFVAIVLLGSAISAIFANDGTALILTPIVIEMLLALGFSQAASFAFIMATGFIADTSSLPLIVSNLVNIISADYFHIGFGTYAMTMIPIDVVSIFASLIVLFVFFRKQIPTTYSNDNLTNPSDAITDPLTFTTGWIVLGILLVGYFAANPLGLHVSEIAGSGAAVLIVVAGRQNLNFWTKPRPNILKSSQNPGTTVPINVRRIVREAPWQIVIFSLGMYLVVFGLKNVGFTKYITYATVYLSHHGSIASTLGVGYLIAGLASIMNNMPTVLVGALAIGSSHIGHHATMTAAYANIIGSDLGPKITPIGSLATLLWLDVLKRRGYIITWRSYFKTGMILTIPVLFITLISLAIFRGI